MIDRNGQTQLTTLEDVIPDLLPQKKEVEIYPGRLWCDVAELGVIHIREFSGDLMRAIESMFAAGVIGGSSGQDVFLRMVPFVVENLADLIAKTTQLKARIEPGEPWTRVSGSIMDLRHDALPVVAPAWIRLNFAQPGKLKPWVDTIEDLIHHATGSTEFSLAKLLSEASSQAASALQPSSTTSNQDSHTEASQSGSSEPSDVALEPTANT